MTKEILILIMEVCGVGANGGYGNYAVYREAQDCQIYMHKCVTVTSPVHLLTTTSKCIIERGYSRHWSYKK